MELKKLTKEEWLNLIPCKLYNKKENTSYSIISISNEGLYYNEEIQVMNDDEFSWSLYDTITRQILLKFSEINKHFELGIEPTEKQIEWLKHYDKMTKSMTKQEAWQIINNHVNQTKAKIEEYNKKLSSRYVSKVLDKMLDADDIVGQCGGCYEEDDFYC